MNLKDFTTNTIFDTDKGDLGYIENFYNDLFSPRKEATHRLLEIGVQAGGSIDLWSKYFTNAQIYGLDITDASPRFQNRSNVTLIQDNAYTPATCDKFSDNFFDIVIDDGPHTFESMVFFVKHYLPKVKSGGVLVLEDIIDTSWTPRLLELIDPSVGKITVHDMRGKQKTDGLLNRWATGLDVIVVEKY